MSNEGESKPMQKNRIDWAGVRRRLEKARSAMEQGWKPGPEEREKILQTRAHDLARETEKPGAGETIEVVEFSLAHERYGIETSYVREVYPLKDVTAVPCTPSFVLGIINVRGQIISVIDLKKFFDLSERGLGELNKVIILSSESMEFGILSDVIIGVRSLTLSGLQPSIPTLTGVRKEYLRGVTEDRLVVLDIGKLMADRTIIVDEEVGL
jgi:purine-binding chemotaxis protein CheW